MKIISTSIPDILVIEPIVFHDDRGWFYESFNERRFAELSGINVRFVQDNHSMSKRHVLRGMHYQIQQPQGRLVRVIAGEIFDVAIDIRKSSRTFGQWVGTMLSAANKRQVWIPPGFAHGFVTISGTAEVVYKTTEYWAAESERSILWDDPTLGITWPFESEPYLSEKDRKGKLLAEAETYA